MRKGFQTSSILMDRRLQESLEKYTTTSWGLCAEHAQLHKDVYITLIEGNPERSGALSAEGMLALGEAYRTGTIAHVPRYIFAAIVESSIPDKLAAVFVKPGVIELVRARMQPH